MPKMVTGFRLGVAPLDHFVPESARLESTSCSQRVSWRSITTYGSLRSRFREKSGETLIVVVFFSPKRNRKMIMYICSNNKAGILPVRGSPPALLLTGLSTPGHWQLATAFIDLVRNSQWYKTKTISLPTLSRKPSPEVPTSKQAMLQIWQIARAPSANWSVSNVCQCHGFPASGNTWVDNILVFVYIAGACPDVPSLPGPGGFFLPRMFHASKP